MRGIYIVIGIILLLTLGIVGFSLFNQRTSQTSSESTAIQAGQDQNSGSAALDLSDQYIVYSKEAFESNSNKKRVLFFYANWCPTCRPADANFSSNISKIPEDVVLIRVNYNDSETDQEEKDLAEKYQVTYQHTFVQIDEEGNVVTKWNGGQINELLENIK
ncbi:hypothetical protein A3A75_02090 [Candidatus Woesebacteria bacterium RIFCSPLOWO2_01_FULL_39_10]|uniref:Thioredoxin domain-containing protein n=1 Tax=Candidatus Woesebacteria bacterium RIFCSPLOWO2_01_FULL_39_10 TaxID=1802516 RepID=A0A1F8B6R9_9BACT|nr:MAG: hypothetical protein A3A75_02090 [Candidatus Woesebacteria bacterium RIFCSPLOWO2_01_FULL_39_10]